MSTMRIGAVTACVAMALALGCAEDGTSVQADTGPVMDGGTDEEQLRACELEEPCFESTALMVEGRIAHVLLFDCTIRALAAGTPGRYLHATDSMWSDGAAGARHTLVVAEDGSALYTRVPHATGAAEIDGSDAQAQRCVLRPRSYFEACVAAFEGYVAVPFGTPPSGDAWACAFGNGGGEAVSELHWFESCEALEVLVCE